MATPWERRAPDHYLVQNDSGTLVQEQLLDRLGVPVDLTGASVKYMLWFPGAAAALVNAAATIVGSATNGTVSFTPTATHTAASGDALEEWQVTYAGGLIQTFPAVEKHKVRIRGDLAA